MSSLFKQKRSRYWWYKGRNQAGDLIRRSTETTDKQIAKQYQKTWDKVFRGTTEAPVTLPELIEAWQAVNVLNANEKQIRRNRGYVEEYLLQQGVKTPEQISRLSVEGWMAYLTKIGLKNKTVRNKLSALSSFCSYLVKRGVLDENSAAGFKITIEDIPPRYLTPQQLKKALKIAEKNGFLAEFAVAVYTGMRLGEIRRMDWQDIDWRGRMIIIPKTKSNRPRSVPITRKLYNILYPMRKKSGPVFPGRYAKALGYSGYRKPHTFWKHFRHIQEAFPDVFLDGMGSHTTGRAWHTIRHTTATLYVQHNGDLGRLGQHLGHKDPKTTRRYAHYQPQKDDILEKI